jgi:hypothetical protein
MNWKCFDLTFNIKSAIHIGYRKIGLLQLTRYYVPGKNLWAALTARMTPILRNSPSRLDYEEIGVLLRKNTIFSYFYLQNDVKLLTPKFKEGKGLLYGDFFQDEFEQRFIASIPSTAIEHEMGSAEYGSLHEIEVITGGDKETGNPVYLCGHLFVKDQENLNFQENDISLESKSIIQILKEGVLVGGERSYGFGKICLKEFHETRSSEYELKNEILVTLGAGTPIQAHLKVTEGVSLKGEVEAFSGRKWGAKGSGREKSKPLIAWIPGSIAEENYQLKIGEFGVLESTRTRMKDSQKTSI